MEPTPAAHSGELKWLRVNDNDGGNDGDGNQADEGGSDDMMDRRMMVMMTATAMRVMMAITTMNGGAGASDVFFGLHWCMPGFPQPAALTLRARSHTKHASETHTCRAKKVFFPGKRTPSHQRARGSARSQIRIARMHLAS